MGGGGWSLVTTVMRGMDESRNPSNVEAVRVSAEGYSLSFATLTPGVQSSVMENGVPIPTIGSVSVSVTRSSSGSGHAQNAALPSRIPHLASLFFVTMGSFLFHLL